MIKDIREFLFVHFLPVTRHFGLIAAKARGPKEHHSFTLFSECREVTDEIVVFKKPVYVFTKPDFFERYFNGLLAQNLGFGELYEHASRENLSLFFRNLDFYRQALDAANIQPDNKAILKKINEIIEAEEKRRKPAFDLPETLADIKRRLVANYAVLTRSRHLSQLKTLLGHSK